MGVLGTVYFVYETELGPSHFTVLILYKISVIINIPSYFSTIFLRTFPERSFGQTGGFYVLFSTIVC